MLDRGRHDPSHTGRGLRDPLPTPFALSPLADDAAPATVVKRRARIGAVLATAAAIALGATAAPALAGTFTLDLAPQSDAVVGRPLVIKATGTVPPQDVGFPYWFSLDAIPTAVTATCPADQGEGAQVALGGGGSIVVLSQSQHPNIAGDFTIPVAVTPSAPGSLLLCGYTDDGGAVTLATTSLTLNIQPAPSHRRSLRKAKARCRRLHSRRARARCLRRVRLRADGAGIAQNLRAGR